MSKLPNKPEKCPACGLKLDNIEVIYVHGDGIMTHSHCRMVIARDEGNDWQLMSTKEIREWALGAGHNTHFQVGNGPICKWANEEEK